MSWGETHVIFPDSVLLASDELEAGLPALVGAAVPVGNRVPSPRPARFVRVRRQGGTRITVVSEAAQLEVQAWGADQAQAEDLGQACRSVLFAMQGRTVAGVPIYRVEDVGGPAEVPDPLSDQPVSQFSVALLVRAATA